MRRVAGILVGSVSLRRRSLADPLGRNLREYGIPHSKDLDRVVIGESRFYKDELLRFVRNIRRWHDTPSWTERRFEQYEHGLFMAFFTIRRLIECDKLSERTVDQGIPVQVFKPTGARITLMSRYDVSELYDLEKPRRDKRSLLFLCNQVIHSYIFQIWSERAGQGSSIFFSSDRRRRREAFRLTRGTISHVLTRVGTDYPSSMNIKWDEARADYVLYDAR